MADVELKIQILKKSMGTFNNWLDSCDQLLGDLPSQLETCKPSMLRELALKSKDLLLQMKERCSYIQEVNNLCKEVGQEAFSSTSQRGEGHVLLSTFSDNLAELSVEVRDLNTRFSTTCIRAKQHYTDLSDALNIILEDQSSLKSFTFSMASPPPMPEGTHSDLNDHPNDSTHGNQADSKRGTKGQSHVKLRNPETRGKKSRSKRSSKKAKSLHFGEDKDTADYPFEIITLDQSPPRLRRSRSWSTSTDLDEVLSKQETQSNRGDPLEGCPLGLSHDGHSSSPANQLTSNVKNGVCAISGATSHTPDTTANSAVSGFPPKQETGGASGASVLAPRQHRTEAITALDQNNTAIIRHRAPRLTSRTRTLSSSSSEFERGGSARGSPSGSLRGSRRSNRRPKSAVLVSGDDNSLAQFYYLADQTSDDPGTPIPDFPNLDSPVIKLSPGLKLGSSPTGKMSTAVQRAGYTGNRSNHTGGQSSQLLDHSGTASVDSLNVQQELTNRVVSVMSDQNDSTDLMSVAVYDVSCVGGEAIRSETRRSKSMDELSQVARGGGKSGKVDLSSRLGDLSFRLQEFVHSIAESRRCTLQSLSLELQLGEVKAMLTILEVHEIELTRLMANFSPLAKRKLDKMKIPKTLMNSRAYPEEEVLAKQDEIKKLNERVGLLKQHCEEAIEQTEQVLEFVVQYEKEFKLLKDFLSSHASSVEAIQKEIEAQPEKNWQQLSEELTTVSEKKSQLKCIHEMSVHLLYLEPIFEGGQVRDDLKVLTEKFQNLTLKIFGLLEDQAKLQTEQLLMDTSVMSSWVSEASLSVQALAKKIRKPNGVRDKLLATRETLSKELEKHQTSLESISNKLRPLTAVLNPDEDDNLKALVKQVDANRQSLKHVETNLLDVRIDLTPGHELSAPDQSFFSRSLTRGDRGSKKRQQQRDRVMSDFGQVDTAGGQTDLSSLSTGSGRVVRSHSEDHYAEIGSIQAEILGKRQLNGPSLVPDPVLGGTRGPGGLVPDPVLGGTGGPGSLAIRKERDKSSPYASLDEVLPSPLVDYDHAPSRPLDSVIEQLPNSVLSSTTSSHVHTPSHTPSHSPSKLSGNQQVQYAEVEITQNKKPSLPQSSSASSLDRLQGQRLLDPTYAEIGRKANGSPLYADINKIRKSKHSGVVEVTSSPEIDQSRRMSTYTEIEVGIVPEISSEKKVNKKPTMDRRRKRSRRFSLHEELLEFIGEEWAELSLKKTVHQAALDEASLDQSLSQLADPEQKAMCQKFIRGVREVEAGVQGIVDQISIVKPPETTDLERVHTAIDQCQKFLDRLNKLHPKLDSHNMESIHLIGVLGRSPTSARVSQLIEIRLFEISTLWYSANLKISSHMQELRSQEGEINYLYRQLQKLSRALKEGTTLLDQRKTVTDVDSYLNHCKVVSGKLNDLSDIRSQVEADVQETVSQTPQSSVSQELLEQLQQINTDWSNLATDLTHMASLEPVLYKIMLNNIDSELVAMETALKTLRVRVLKQEGARTNCKISQVQLEKSRLFLSSLKAADSRLAALVSLSSQQSSPAQSLSNKGPGPDSEGDSQSVLGRADGLTVNCSDLLERCGQLVKQANRVVKETGKLSTLLQAELETISQFYDDLRDLQLWMSDTQSMLQLPSAGPPTETTSISQLRGKHQAIFQQIVTRQPKLISVQSLSEALLALPSNPSEQELITKKISDLCTQWDNLCKQIVPAGSLPQVMTPTGGDRRLQFEPPSEFSDISNMIEWLSMIEFRLQPVMITVGDVKQIQTCFQDLLMIEGEIQSRETDYHAFVGDSTIPTSLQLYTPSLDPQDTDAGLSNNIKTLLGITTPESAYQIPIKTIRPQGDGTLEWPQDATQQIDNGTQNGVTENGDSDCTTPLVSPNGTLTRYHSEGPEAKHQNGGSFKCRAGLELDLSGGMDLRQNSVGGDSYSLMSLSSLMSPSSMSDEVYQLVLLWTGVWGGIQQRKKHFESTLKAWQHFELKKEDFCNFLSKAEKRVSSFLESLSRCKDFTVVQNEITVQQVFINETTTYQHRLSDLNQVSQDLITNRHSNDDTRDLQDMMTDLNSRWRNVMESVAQSQPTIRALVANWSEFYREYQSFQQWIKNLDTDMSNLNPFVTDLTAVKIQLEKQKEIQQELSSREGGMETVRLLAYKLLQGEGGNHLNHTAIHSRLDNLARRFKHLETLAQERRSALENALTEKQDFISHLADCLAWLNQAEVHLSAQKPLGTDFDTVHAQLEAQEAFWKEVMEQKTKIESVIALGNRLVTESHWPQGAGEELRSQFGGVETRWRNIFVDGEEWGKLLNNVHPEMETFQILCSECGQKLSDSELIAGKFEPVSRKLPTLEKQLMAVDIYETSLVAIGNTLEAIVLSQHKQVQLGVKVTSELYQLVKRFHQRWNLLKRMVDERRVKVQSAQIKYDPGNLSISDLPRNWKRVVTETGTPYFINTAAGNSTQWEHPDLSTLHSDLHSLSSYPSPAYPIALRLRELQRKTQLSLLQTRHCMEVYATHVSDPAHKVYLTNHLLSFYDMVVLTVDMFQKVEEEVEKAVGTVSRGNYFYINQAVELTTCWLRDVFDLEHQGKVECVSLQLAVVCLSRGKLEEKYRALFKVISGGQSSIDLTQVASFLEQVMTIGQSVTDVPFCSPRAVEICARECFKKYVGVGRLHLPQFISWLQTEPTPLSWLPILHRLCVSEHAHHDVRCGVCKAQPIVGFRYHCVQCTTFDMCQTCYWSGKTVKGHDRTKHFMEEYCVPKPADDVKDLLNTIRKSFRRKKKPLQSNPTHDSPSVPHKMKVGVANSADVNTIGEQRWTSSNKKSSSSSKLQIPSYDQIHVRDNAHHSSTGGGEFHPGRRFTVLGDELTPGWKASSRASMRRTSSPPPSIPETGDMTWWPTHKQPPSIPNMQPRDLEASLTKISQTRKSLSFRLRSLREKQGSPTPQDILLDQEGEQATPNTRGHSPTPEDELRRRNAMLQGRVQLLQEHNLRLENCISQLKIISNIQQPSLTSGDHHRASPRPPPAHHSPGRQTKPPPLPYRPVPADTYCIPISSLTARVDHYDIPPSNRKSVSDIYDVPPSNRKSVSDIYDVPPNSGASSSDVYDIPSNRNGVSSRSDSIYSVPSARLATSSPDYDIPSSRSPSRPNTFSDDYDVPPHTSTDHLKKSNNLTSDYSVPRLLASHVVRSNPEIPPPKLPRRTPAVML